VYQITVIHPPKRMYRSSNVLRGVEFQCRNYPNDAPSERPSAQLAAMS